MMSKELKTPHMRQKKRNCTVLCPSGWRMKPYAWNMTPFAIPLAKKGKGKKGSKKKKETQQIWS